MPLPVQLHHVRAKSCTGKIKYATIERAQDGLLRLAEGIARGERYSYKTGPLNIYACDLCGRYHIGHRPKVLA